MDTNNSRVAQPNRFHLFGVETFERVVKGAVGGQHGLTIGHSSVSSSVVFRMSTRQSRKLHGAGEVFSASAAPDARSRIASSISAAILRPASAIGIPPLWMFDITVRSGSIDLSVGR